MNGVVHGWVSAWVDGCRVGECVAELKKVGSTLPEHLRFSPGTHKARNYPKDV